MRRPARLDSGRAWLASGAGVTLRGYTRRYGVDRYTAYDELTMLGVTLPAEDERWSVRPPSTPTDARRDREVDHLPDPTDDLPCGWMWWGGEFMFVAGFTSGGAPFGMRVDEFPESELPPELRGFQPPAGPADGSLNESEPPF